MSCTVRTVEPGLELLAERLVREFVQVRVVTARALLSDAVTVEVELGDRTHRHLCTAVIGAVSDSDDRERATRIAVNRILEHNPEWRRRDRRVLALAHAGSNAML